MKWSFYHIYISFTIKTLRKILQRDSLVKHKQPPAPTRIAVKEIHVQLPSPLKVRRAT